jgi:hypothetical protein
MKVLGQKYKEIYAYPFNYQQIILGRPYQTYQTYYQTYLQTANCDFNLSRIFVTFFLNPSLYG